MKISFTSPLNHKCPVCSHDLYKDFQDKLFLNAFGIKKFNCKKCNSLLLWQADINLFLAILGGALTIASAISLPIAANYFGELSNISLILAGSGAISAIIAWVGILRMTVRQAN